MPAAYTSVLSVQVLDFEDMCLLVQHARLICDFCSSGQRFACGFLQIPPHGGHPCRPANDSPCRVRRELSPPSGCALPGAHNRTARRKPAVSPAVSSRFTVLSFPRNQKTRNSELCNMERGTCNERLASVLSGKFPPLIVRAVRYHSLWQDHISDCNSPHTIERFCVPGCEPPRPSAVWPKGLS